MRARRFKADAYNITFQTSMSRRHAEELVEAVRGYEADDKKEERFAAVECKRCFYLYRGRVGGCAMTRWSCGVCGKKSMHGSTAVPCICKDCGTKHKLCTYCGGDLDMRERRRKFPEIVEIEDDEVPV
jgi:hypothetical protein